MAGNATLANRFVLKNKWPALGGMTFQAGAVCTQHSDAAALHLLRHVGPAAFDGVALVRVMTIRAADFAFKHRMMMGQLERGFHFRVALETGFRRFSWIEDRVTRAARLVVQAARPVTRFAPDILSVRSLGFEPSVSRRPKIARDRFVARRAFFRADEFRAGNTRRREDGVV